jgi:hypothetical protein
VARKDSAGSGGKGSGSGDAAGEAKELPQVSGVSRTPLFHAQHSERYARQQLIRDYEDAVGANLIVVIDQIFPRGLTFLEELVFDCEPDKPLHVVLASPGGDGETAIRMVRSLQTRCTELTVIVPDMAKSAATLLCLGANRILMGPGGDLGPVDPQFPIEGRGLVGCKEIVMAVAEAEERITNSPNTFPLYANLLADINMLMVEQARNALARCGSQVREALSCRGNYEDGELDELSEALRAPFIDEPSAHSAVISAADAAGYGLPAEAIDTKSDDWQRVWQLWTRYFALGCWPAGNIAVYEGRRASHLLGA